MAKETMSFEKKLEKINEIIEKLENKEIELEVAIKLYDECVIAIKEAEKILNTAEGKINKIIAKAEGYSLEKFEVNND